MNTNDAINKVDNNTDTIIISNTHDKKLNLLRKEQKS